MGRKLGFLLLLLAFGATVETAWSVKHHAVWDIGAEGCRIVGAGPFPRPRARSSPVPDHPDLRAAPARPRQAPAGEGARALAHAGPRGP